MHRPISFLTWNPHSLSKKWSKRAKSRILRRLKIRMRRKRKQMKRIIRLSFLQE
jgi:hypothetical protein